MYKKVWECDDSWWQLRRGDFSLADDFVESAAVFAGINTDDPECFASTIISVGDHSLLRPGDIVVSDGIGCDKFFLRQSVAT